MAVVVADNPQGSDMTVAETMSPMEVLAALSVQQGHQQALCFMLVIPGFGFGGFD